MGDGRILAAKEKALTPEVQMERAKSAREKKAAKQSAAKSVLDRQEDLINTPSILGNLVEQPNSFTRSESNDFTLNLSEESNSSETAALKQTGRSESALASADSTPAADVQDVFLRSFMPPGNNTSDSY